MSTKPLHDIECLPRGACFCMNAPARLAVVVTHTRASTEVGPDYCQECSEAVSEWVSWPCPHAAHLTAQRPTPAPTEES